MTTGILTVLEEVGYPVGDGTPEDAIRRLAQDYAEAREALHNSTADLRVSPEEWHSWSLPRRVQFLRNRHALFMRQCDQARAEKAEALVVMERLTQQSIALGNENDAAHSYLDAAGVPKHVGLLERASLTTRLGWLESTLEIRIKTRLAQEHSSQVMTTAMSDQALRSAVAERLLHDPTGDERVVLAARLLLEGARG